MTRLGTRVAMAGPSDSMKKELAEVTGLKSGLSEATELRAGSRWSLVVAIILGVSRFFVLAPGRRLVNV